MTKKSGLGQGFVLDGIDLSGDTGSADQISIPRPVTEVTDISQFAQERRHLQRDGNLSWSSWFNPDRAHAELENPPITDRIGTWLTGRNLGDSAKSLVGKQLNYDPTRNQDGSMSIAVQIQANGFGGEWGKLLTAGFETFGGIGDGSSVDFGAATNFGLQAYLQLTAFTGTDITVAIHDSADNSAFALVTGATFTAMTGVGAQRIQTARDQTVRQFVRINLTGTFTSATLVVMIKKNLHEVLF